MAKLLPPSADVLSAPSAAHESAAPVSDLPEGWDTARIGDVLRLTNGAAFKPSDWTETGPPIIRIQNLNNPNAPFNRCSKVLPEKLRVRSGDLLFAWSGTPGTSFGAHIWRGCEAWLNQHIFRVEFNASLFEPEFLRLAINRNLDDYIRQAHGGAGLAHITKGRFEAATLIVPPLAEQRRMLARLHELEERSRRARAALDAVPLLLTHARQSLLVAAFRGALTQTWRKKHPQALSSAQWAAKIKVQRRARWEVEISRRRQRAGKDSKDRHWIQSYKEAAELRSRVLTSLPTGWTCLSAEGCTWEVIVGYVGPMKSQYVASGIPFLRSQNVRANRFDPKELIYVSPDFHETLRKSALSPGDLGIVRSGAPGTACVIPAELETANCSDLVVARPLGVVAPQYLSYYLNSPVAAEQVFDLQVGVAQQHFNVGAMSKLAVPLPQPAEQREIVRQLAGC